MKISIKIKKEEKQNTFILFWNPAISDCEIGDFHDFIRNSTDFNWSIWDYQQAKIGDRFYMVRCGEGNTGIIMCGTFASNPFWGEDWSEQERNNMHYIKLSQEMYFSPEHCTILTTAELQAAIPDFDWTGGHSGRLLDPESAEKLEEMWEKFLGNKESFTLIDDDDIAVFPS